jgi:acetyl esterase/lipase
MRHTLRRVFDRGRVTPVLLRTACLLDYAGTLLRAPRGSHVARLTCDGYRAEWVLGPGVSGPRTVGSEPVGPGSAGAGPPTAVLYFHGGGFFSCGLRTHRRLVARISAAAGAPVLNVGYRQLPEVALSDTIDDCMDAYRLLLRQGYPGEAVVFAGDSAGGYLAFTVALRALAEGLPSPGGIVALSPWLDLDCTHSAEHANGTLDPYIPVHQISALAPLLYGDNGPLESLLDADLAALPPVLIQVGSVEVLRSDAELMAAALDEAGVPVRLQIWLRQVHVFQMFADLVPEGHWAIADIGGFVRAVVDQAGGAVAA